MFGLNVPAIMRPIAASTSMTASAFASSSRLTLSPTLASVPTQIRFRSDLAPRRTKYRKSQKGRASLPTGGSLKGTTLEQGTYGIRTLGAVRLTADQLSSAQTAIKRKIKPVKGAEVFMRVFPDVPVCVKGNETRMGKGKGSFEYWACRVPLGRVIFEVGGGGIREEIAKQGEFICPLTSSLATLRLAQVKLPVQTEFINTSTPPRLGSISSSTLAPPPAALPAPAQLADLDAKDEGGAVDVVLSREERLVHDLEGAVAGLEALKVDDAQQPSASA